MHADFVDCLFSNCINVHVYYALCQLCCAGLKPCVVDAGRIRGPALVIASQTTSSPPLKGRSPASPHPNNLLPRRCHLRNLGCLIASIMAVCTPFPLGFYGRWVSYIDEHGILDNRSITVDPRTLIYAGCGRVS